MNGYTSQMGMSRSTRAPQNGTVGIGASRRTELRAGSAAAPARRGVAALELLALAFAMHARLLEHTRQQRVVPIRVEQLIHRVESLEGVLAVEDTGLVGALLVEIQDPSPEAAVDRRAADDQRIAEPALVELLDARGHLLAGAHQQRRQADRVGVRPRAPCR